MSILNHKIIFLSIAPSEVDIYLVMSAIAWAQTTVTVDECMFQECAYGRALFLIFINDNIITDISRTSDYALRYTKDHFFMVHSSVHYQNKSLQFVPLGEHL